MKEAIKTEVNLHLDKRRKGIVAEHSQYSLKLMKELNDSIDRFANELTKSWTEFELNLFETVGKTIIKYDEMLEKGLVRKEQYEKQIDRIYQKLEMLQDLHEERFSLMTKDQIGQLKEAVKTFTSGY